MLPSLLKALIIVVLLDFSKSDVTNLLENYVLGYKDIKIKCFTKKLMPRTECATIIMIELK